MKTIAKIEFSGNLVREHSYTPVVEELGEHKSTAELFDHENGTSYGIEWDIPELEETEEIGIWCEEGTKVICDYDGVFEICKEILDWLDTLGFNTEYCR